MWLVGWLVGSIASWLIGVRATVRVDVPGHRGLADLGVKEYPPALELHWGVRFFFDRPAVP